MHLDTRESQEIDVQQSTVKQLQKRYYGEFQEHDEVVETKERERGTKRNGDNHYTAMTRQHAKQSQITPLSALL